MIDINVEKKYHDVDGNPCSLYYLVKYEPEWAASRIREGEKAIAKLKEYLSATLEDGFVTIDASGSVVRRSEAEK